MSFVNSWDNEVRAASYAKLEFPNTYYLAYRDLPEIIGRHIKGNRAVDFGCGAGRSTRFTSKLGFKVTGIDISPEMLKMALNSDPHGDYRQVSDGDYFHLGSSCFDLVQAIFTFDNIPGAENRAHILKGLAELLNERGRIILLDSTEELYINEWASFSTKDLPGNFTARSGEIVRTIMHDVEDSRPVDDIFWTHDDYLEMFERAGLKMEASYYPLGRHEEPFEWKSETEMAPWVIYVLKK